MDTDLIQWAQTPIGVGDAPGTDELLASANLPLPGVPNPTLRPVRRRPNKGRVKRTDRTPGLETPPWDIIRSLNIPTPPAGLVCLPYTPLNWRRGGRYLLWKAQVRTMWGTTCHLCGHDEAYTADHLIPVSVWSNQPYEPALARPAHGVVQPDGTEGCPTCRVKCNSSRGNKQLADQILNYKPPVEL